MNSLICAACGGTTLLERYRALDGTEWCRACADRVADEQRENCGPEVERGLVDLHARVLDVLQDEAQRRAPGWRR